MPKDVRLRKSKQQRPQTSKPDDLYNIEEDYENLVGLNLFQEVTADSLPIITEQTDDNTEKDIYLPELIIEGIEKMEKDVDAVKSVNESVQEIEKKIDVFEPINENIEEEMESTEGNIGEEIMVETCPQLTSVKLPKIGSEIENNKLSPFLIPEDIGSHNVNNPPPNFTHHNNKDLNTMSGIDTEKLTEREKIEKFPHEEAYYFMKSRDHLRVLRRSTAFTRVHKGSKTEHPYVDPILHHTFLDQGYIKENVLPLEQEMVIDLMLLSPDIASEIYHKYREQHFLEKDGAAVAKEYRDNIQELNNLEDAAYMALRTNDADKIRKFNYVRDKYKNLSARPKQLHSLKVQQSLKVR